jgi:hypothetical protein
MTSIVAANVFLTPFNSRREKSWCLRPLGIFRFKMVSKSNNATRAAFYFVCKPCHVVKSTCGCFFTLYSSTKIEAFIDTKKAIAPYSREVLLRKIA